ncbi:MAG: hypothetical protein PHS95_03360 [Candidatus Pacebacteria bacterium]|nr:hypothetical protein [Candidatus Paceibacterota bacterium]
MKEHDLPLWQKVLTACALVPSLLITAMSINMDTYYGPSGIALINQTVLNGNSLLEVVIIVGIIVFSIFEYLKALDDASRKKIALAGTGVTIFLSIFFFMWTTANFLISINFQNLASTGYLYNITTYSFLGMPILLGFLGYLIAKYQAFDMKLIKSIVYIIALMALLFVGLFFA